MKGGEDMRELNGGCLCGKVRYSARAEPALVAVCHCKNCQKQAGTAFGTIVGIPKSALSIKGQLKTFHDTGDTTHLEVNRNFCPECGSPITTDAAAMPEMTFIKAGSLDDTSWLDPKMHLFCDSAQSWVPIAEGSQKFAKMPG